MFNFLNKIKSAFVSLNENRISSGNKDGHKKTVRRSSVDV